jgi:hypothetical protein
MTMNKKELILAIILAALLFPVIHTVTTRSEERRQRRSRHYRGNSRSSDMKQLAMALLGYSGDHGGAFPDTLWKLPDEDYISAGYVANPADIDPKPEDMGIYHRYHYFGNEVRDDDMNSTERPILIYPYLNRGSRHATILYIAGHVEGRDNLSQDEVLDLINDASGSW